MVGRGRNRSPQQTLVHLVSSGQCTRVVSRCIILGAILPGGRHHVVSVAAAACGTPLLRCVAHTHCTSGITCFGWVGRTQTGSHTPPENPHNDKGTERSICIQIPLLLPDAAHTKLNPQPEGLAYLRTHLTFPAHNSSVASFLSCHSETYQCCYGVLLCDLRTFATRRRRNLEGQGCVA